MLRHEMADRPADRGRVFRFAGRRIARRGIRAGASGIIERSNSDHFWGIGPHAGLELSGRRNPWGLGWVARLDTALLFGEVHQRFGELSTAGVASEVGFDNHEEVPTLGGFLGLDWRPPCHMNLDILVGYIGRILVERGPHERPGHLQRPIGR